MPKLRNRASTADQPSLSLGVREVANVVLLIAGSWEGSPRLAHKNQRQGHGRFMFGSRETFLKRDRTSMYAARRTRRVTTCEVVAADDFLEA